MARTSKRYVQKAEDSIDKIFYKAGIYTRLSSERKEEWREKSSSIETQVLCCKEYALKENINPGDLVLRLHELPPDFRQTFRHPLGDLRGGRDGIAAVKAHPGGDDAFHHRLIALHQKRPRHRHVPSFFTKMAKSGQRSSHCPQSSSEQPSFAVTKLPKWRFGIIVLIYSKENMIVVLTL